MADDTTQEKQVEEAPREEAQEQPPEKPSTTETVEDAQRAVEAYVQDQTNGALANAEAAVAYLEEAANLPLTEDELGQVAAAQDALRRLQAEIDKTTDKVESPEIEGGLEEQKETCLADESLRPFYLAGEKASRMAAEQTDPASQALRAELMKAVLSAVVDRNPGDNEATLRDRAQQALTAIFVRGDLSYLATVEAKINASAASGGTTAIYEQATQMALARQAALNEGALDKIDAAQLQSAVGSTEVGPKSLSAFRVGVLMGRQGLAQLDASQLVGNIEGEVQEIIDGNIRDQIAEAEEVESEQNALKQTETPPTAEMTTPPNQQEYAEEKKTEKPEKPSTTKLEESVPLEESHPVQEPEKEQQAKPNRPPEQVETLI